MGRYRPRHARPTRPVARALPALSLVGVCAGSLSTLGDHAQAIAPIPSVGAASTTFAAEPVIQALPSRALQRSRPLPASDRLLLPATGLATRPAAHGRVPVTALGAYRSAAAQLATEAPGCGLRWQLLAALGYVASDHGRDAATSLLDGSEGWEMSDTDQGRYDGSAVLDGPVGPLQLLPWTWERVNDGGSPDDLRDSAVAAGRYLCAVAGDLRRPLRERAALAAYSRARGFAALVTHVEALYLS